MRELIRVTCELNDIEVLGQAADGLEAIAKVEELRPELIILDYMLPNMSGELVAGAIRALVPEATIIAFSAIVDSQPPWSDAFVTKARIADLPELIHFLGDQPGKA